MYFHFVITSRVVCQNNARKLYIKSFPRNFLCGQKLIIDQRRNFSKRINHEKNHSPICTHVRKGAEELYVFHDAWNVVS